MPARSLARWLLAVALFNVACTRRPAYAPAHPAPARGDAPVGAPPVHPDVAIEHAWARRVVLESEYGSTGGRVTRWAHSPTLSVFGGGEEHRAAVLEVVAHINEVLRGTPVQIGLARDSDPSAHIEVHFAPVASFHEIAQQHGFWYVEGNDGFFWMFWHDDRALRKTYVLLAIDRLFGSYLRHVTFEEITQSFGLANDAPTYADSIFFARGSDGGAAVRPSLLDDRLLRFVYTSLRPGDGGAAFDAAFTRTWR